MQTNNTTVPGVINNTIAPRRTKSMDTCFHGYAAVNASYNFGITGDQVAPTNVIMSPSTKQQLITI